MKVPITGFLVLFFLLKSQLFFSQAIIVDHNCAKLDPIPEFAILQAKSDLHIAYWHTSHGSQLTEGMKSLRDLDLTNLVGYKGDIYNWNDGGTDGALDLDDNYEGDLGHNGDLGWETTTRTYLADPTNSDVNVIIWSWCGGASDNTEAGMNIYLNAMNQLEIDFPNIKFIYMTGHLDGTGESGNLHVMNEQIRNYCLNNHKVLYDFADIESYDPDGNYYLDKLATDNCDYDSEGNGTRNANWATEWQNSHTEGADWYSCSAAHSQALNGNLKAYAAWWLWAKLAGWDDGSDVILNITPDEPMDECNLGSRSLNITLTGDTFIDDQLTNGNFLLNGAPSTTTVESVTYIDNENAILFLSFDGTDFDSDYLHFSIAIAGSELTSGNELSSNELEISANDEELTAEAEVSLSETNLDAGIININLTGESFDDNQFSSESFQLNNAPSGTSIELIEYVDATNATISLAFDGTDFDADFEQLSISISADELIGCQDLTSESLTVYSELEPSAYASISEDLIESQLNGAVILLELDDEIFLSGCFSSDKYIFKNVPNGITLGSIECISDTRVKLTLSYDETDFDLDSTNFYILIDESALLGNLNLTTNSLTIFADIESGISDVNDNNQIRIFPNPTNGIINVEYMSSTNDKINIQIIDALGKKIIQKEYRFSNTQFKTTIDVNSIDKGQYYLILNQGKTKVVKSIILQ